MENEIICLECGAENNYEIKKDIVKFEGEGYSFEMEVEIPFCKECGAFVYVEEIEEEIAKRANRKIRKLKGIISKEEIVQILETYHVSQKFLSRLLGWGEITLTRYISGGYTPNEVNSARLKQLSNPYMFLSLLESNKELALKGEKEKAAYDKACKYVGEEIEKLEKEPIFGVADWFLSWSTEETPMTHLALQKMLYFAQGWSRALTGKWLFPDNCQAWTHGAVYPVVFEKFRNYKYLKLPQVKRNIVFDTEQLAILEMVKTFYFDVYSAKRLEHICHKEEPYIMARKECPEGERCSNYLDKKEIEKYYRKIAEQFGVMVDDMSGIKRYLSLL